MKWKEYSMMAAAVLAGGTANNQVFYQDIEPDIDLSPPGAWPWFSLDEELDLNHDGINDFRIQLIGTYTYTGWGYEGWFKMGYAIPLNNHEIHIASSPVYDWCTFGWFAGEMNNIANYSNGMVIDPTPMVGNFVHPPNENFDEQLLFMQRDKPVFGSTWYFTCTGDPADFAVATAGLWFDMSMQNVPIQFKNGGALYTGWIRLSVTEGTIQVHDYAISMEAGAAITAGSTAGAVIATVPVPGIVPVMPTKAYLNWTVAPDAIKYRYRYREVGAPVWITKLTTGTTKLLKSLDCATAYEWQVQAVYDDTPKLNSAWSALQTFTTAACRLDGAKETTTADIRLYPNPASASVTVQAITDAYQLDMFVELYNLQGEKLKSYVTNDTAFEMDVSDVPAGTYLVVVHTAEGEAFTQQVVIAH